MTLPSKFASISFATVAATLVATGCKSDSPSTEPVTTSQIEKTTYRSNGEQIYVTATSQRGSTIDTKVDPAGKENSMGGMKMPCISCHGPDGHGGPDQKGAMGTAPAKDIRWSKLEKEYDPEKFRLAITEGKDADGTQLKSDMPRWNIGKEDVADLIEYLKQLK